MLIIKNIKNISSIFIILLNSLFYLLTKHIKSNKKCLKKHNFNIDYQSLKVIFTKYSSLLFIALIVINFFVPIHNVILKIPLISSLYSFLILIVIIIQTSYFTTIIKNISINKKKQLCLKRLNLIFKLKIDELIVKYKYKVSLSYIFLTYICLIYI